MMQIDAMWSTEDPVTNFGVDVPRWIDQDISPHDVLSIEQGGCASGAYMPAVTYHTAAKTMAEHGDDVLQFIQDIFGELPKPRDDESWSGLAVFYLSVAVELWASEAQRELSEWEPDDDESAA